MSKRDTIFALDVGASSLRLGCFRPLRGNGIELIRFAIRPLNADPAAEETRIEELTHVLRELVQELGIGRAPVLLSVPGQSVFTRFVRLPMVGRDKIPQLVRYEAQQNVPFPINEVVWDYQLIGSGEGEMDVMLAAMKSEIIERLTDAVATAGLDPELVDIAPMALYNAVRFNYRELPPCTLLIDIGARSTDLVFIEEGRTFNRSIPVGGNTITQQVMREFSLSYEDAEKLKRAHAFVAFGGAYEAPPSEVADKVSKNVRSVMTRLHTEINRSISFYRTQQSGRQPAMALLTGGSSVIPYTDAFLKEKLNIEVDYLNPFQNVAVDGSIDADEIGAQAHLLGEPVGLALRRGLACPIELNLLPTRIAREKAFRRKQPFFAAAMAVLVLVLAVWAVFFHQLAVLGEARLGAVSRQLEDLRSVERQLQHHEGRIARVQTRLDALVALPARRTRWNALLEAVYAHIPNGIWITELTPILPETDAAPEIDEAAYFATYGELPSPDLEAPTAEPEKIIALRLAGYGYLDKVGTTGAIELRNALRASDLFTDETDILEMTTTGQDNVSMSFKMQVVLSEAIEL